MRFDVATTEKLSEMLSLRPTILHLVCHAGQLSLAPNPTPHPTPDPYPTSTPGTLTSTPTLAPTQPLTQSTICVQSRSA
jgi:hypothetical protein